MRVYVRVYCFVRYLMEFQLIGDDLKLLVNGTVKVQVKAPWVDELRTFEVGPFKGVALYKKIEAREIR